MTITSPERVQLYQVTSGNGVRSTGDQQSQQRFLNEVNYVEYFAKKLGDCLGMRSLELGLVEDSEGQTAFYYHDNGSGGPVVNGFFSNSRKPLSRIVEDLRAEH